VSAIVAARRVLRCVMDYLLLEIRGKPTDLGRKVRQLVRSPRREHTRKPDEVRQGIERMFAGPYIELFARETTPGWDSWGNEAGPFDDGPVDTRRQPSSRSRGEERCGQTLRRGSSPTGVVA
jgi:N6-adenosine-specific RNA methylase IME4